MENRFKAILIENPYTVRYSNIIKPKSSNNYIVSEERQFVDVNFDNSYEVHVVDTEADITDTNPWLYDYTNNKLWRMPDFVDTSDGFYAAKHSSLLVLSTDPALGLPSPSKGFLEAFCADPDLIILNCTIFDYDNTCHIEYCSTQDKQETVKEIIEHNLRVPSYENDREREFPNNLPKTTQEFLTKLQKYCDGWKFTGTNPFSDSNKANNRLYNALQSMALELFGDDDYLIELEKLWEDCTGNNTRREVIRKVVTWRRNSEKPVEMLTISEMQWLADFLSNKL